MSECIELKNIKYKSMLLSNSSGKVSSLNSSKPPKNSSLNNLDAFLEAEKAMNKKESWSRLDKTVKLEKLFEWSERFCIEKKWSDVTKNQLKNFLKLSLDKKQLQRVKDVIYDKENSKILGIPNLQFNNRKFTLKRNEKRVSTVKSLGGGKKNKTIKKVDKNNDKLNDKKLE